MNLEEIKSGIRWSMEETDMSQKSCLKWIAKKYDVTQTEVKRILNTMYGSDVLIERGKKNAAKKGYECTPNQRNKGIMRAKEISRQRGLDKRLKEMLS